MALQSSLPLGQLALALAARGAAARTRVNPGQALKTCEAAATQAQVATTRFESVASAEHWMRAGAELRFEMASTLSESDAGQAENELVATSAGRKPGSSQPRGCNRTPVSGSGSAFGNPRSRWQPSAQHAVELQLRKTCLSLRKALLRIVQHVAPTPMSRGKVWIGALRW